MLAKGEAKGKIVPVRLDTAYAWSHSTDDQENPIRHITVLHLGPVISAETAVRAAILQEFRAWQTRLLKQTREDVHTQGKRTTA
jgi:hypothetical protein